MTILDRFLKYIRIPTNSDKKTEKTPSTDAQWNLAHILVEELKQLNMDEVWLDEEHCYVYAVLKGKESVPKVGFISHLDTSEAVTDIGVNPRIIRNYNGESVKLNESETLDVNTYPDLKKHVGKTLITTDGSTLLGADDKAGIAEIMCMLEHIINNNIEHGDIFVAFTPDEEIGQGTKYFDFSKFKADFAYAIDGVNLGEINYQNFNSAIVEIQIEGVMIHPGYAKNKMVNSQLIACQILNSIPKEFPETTEGYEGFYMLSSLQGEIKETKMRFSVADFDKKELERRKDVLKKIVEDLNEKYGNCISVEITNKGQNMEEVISKHMHIIENAKKAMQNVGVNPIVCEVRGGTDGAVLSQKGLPCPLLGTGGNNYHSIYEYICLEDMKKAAEILVEIVKLYSK